MLRAIGNQVEETLRSAVRELRTVVVGLRRELILVSILAVCGVVVALGVVGALGAAVVGLAPSIGTPAALAVVSLSTVLVGVFGGVIAWRSLNWESEGSKASVDSTDSETSGSVFSNESKRPEEAMKSTERSGTNGTGITAGESITDPGLLAATAAAVVLIGGPSAAVKVAGIATDVMKFAGTIASTVALAHHVEAGTHTDDD